MDKDTFTMEDVEASQLETEPETTSPPEEKKAEEAPKSEEGSSFLDAFEKAKAKVEEDAAPKEEPTEPEKSEEETAESRSASDFKLIKGERDEAREKMSALEDRLKELENKDVDDVLKQVQAERDDLSKQLKISSIERHPDFQKRFDSKTDLVVSNAQQTVGEHNADTINRLLRMEESDMRNEGIDQIFA